MRTIRDIREAFMGKPARPECPPRCAPRHPGPKPIPGHVPPPCRLTPDKVEQLDFTTEELNDLIRWMLSHKSQTEMLEAWGDSSTAGLTQKFLTSAYEALQARMSEMADAVSDLEDTDARQDEALDALAGELDELIAESATVAVTVSPQVFYVGAATRLTARLTSSVSAGTLTLRNEEDDTSLSGSGTELRWDFDYTAAASGSVVVRGVATIRGHERTVRASAYAAWPIYYCTGANVTRAWENAASARRTPAGTYRMVTAEGDYLWWMVPEDMSIRKVTLSGFDVPMKAAVTVEFLGTTYKVYQSENTYQAGTMEFVVQ